MVGVIRRKVTETVTLSATGTGTVRIPNNNSSKQWEVVQVSTKTIPAVSGCKAELLENGDFVDTNYFAGTGDTATGPPYLYLDGGEYIEVTFTGGPISGQGVVTLWYVENDRM